MADQPQDGTDSARVGAGADSPTERAIRRVQVGWADPATGVMCDCPVYESSPHAKSVPVYMEVDR